MRLKLFSCAITTLVVATLLLFIACGGGNGGPIVPRGSATPGLVSTTVSDPATCSAPSGPFTRVIVTISRVRAHTNATAADNDPGFVDLTPANMTPVQVDLLGTPNPQCFLAQLGTNVQVAAGTYQQIRIILLANNQEQLVPGNLCGAGNGVNCVVLTSDGSTRQLALSSEATTGIKISGGQISGGSFTVQSNQTANLNLNFNACQSIVTIAANQFRMKPVVRADAIAATNTITGRVVDSTNNTPISGGKVIVALEQRNSSNIGRIVMETTPDGAGNFIFCPVAPGTYEVVATGVSSANVAYAATITTGVQPGANLGNIPVIPQPGSGAVTSPATITGTVTTTGTAGAVPADVVLSALQPLTIGTTNVLMTVPLAAQGTSSITVTTQASGCVGTTACANYSLQVPAANPNLGAFAATGTTYAQNTVAPVSYTVDGQAFVINSPATPNCTPAVAQVSTVSGGGALTVTGGATVTATPMAFGGCQ
jgi:hypothetical protein